MTHYPTATYGQAAQFAAAVAGLSDEAGMELLVDLRAGGVTVDTGKDRGWTNDSVTSPVRSRPRRAAWA